MQQLGIQRQWHPGGTFLADGSRFLVGVEGFSLHDELKLLVGAGLTPQEALASATRLPWLGVLGDRGTIEVGKRADLVLLDANPPLDIANARKIAGVFLSGRWIARTRLDAMLADLSRRNTANRAKYDWNALLRQK